MLYDDLSGHIVPGQAASTALGGCCWVGGQLIAYYVDGDDLILQIGPDKFSFDDPKTEIRAKNDFDKGTTTWRIANGALQRHLTYEGWWAGSKLGRYEVAAQPEEDESWDTMSWTAGLLEDPEERARYKKHLLAGRSS